MGETMSNRPIVVALIVLFLGASFIPFVTADGGTQPPSQAFLPGWNGNIGSSLDPAGENFDNGLRFSNHDFDDEGNMYYIEAEDNVNWLNNQYSTYDSGFHLLKIDSTGQLEYSEFIDCSRYCTSPDYAYTKVVGLHVVDEDQFYLVLSIYYSTLTIGGQQYSTSSQHNLITAFFDNGSWSWVDVETVNSGYAYSSVAFMGIDSTKNFYLVTNQGSSGSWTEYSISSFSPNGTNWVRTLEAPYQSPTYNYSPPLFDIDSNGFHAFLTVPKLIKYDSQTVNCPAYGEEGVCHIWLSLNDAGVKTSAVGSAYTSIQFNRMNVHNGSVYLSGSTLDRVVGSNTESNFTGQKISHSPRYANYVAVMESDVLYTISPLTK